MTIKFKIVWNYLFCEKINSDVQLDLLTEGEWHPDFFTENFFLLTKKFPKEKIFIRKISLFAFLFSVLDEGEIKAEIRNSIKLNFKKGRFPIEEIWKFLCVNYPVKELLRSCPEQKIIKKIRARKSKIKWRIN